MMLLIKKNYFYTLFILMFLCGFARGEDLLVKKVKEGSLTFKDLYKKISKQGSIKSFPDINNTQE